MNKIMWLSFVCIMGIISPHLAGAEVLITEKEAALPASSGVLATRGISRGPAVKLESPAADVPAMAPFNLKVKFEPRGDAKIDPSTIKVTYLKSPPVDLTSRLKTTISSNGIEFTNATAPPGTHPIRILVKDTEGRETNFTFNMVIGQQ